MMGQWTDHRLQCKPRGQGIGLVGPYLQLCGLQGAGELPNSTSAPLGRL